MQGTDILYRGLRICDNSVSGLAELAADAVGPVEGVAGHVQTIKQAQEISEPTRSIVQSIETQVKRPTEPVVVLPTTIVIQPINQIRKIAKLALCPIGEDSKHVEKTLQPVPKIPEFDESLLSVETVPNFSEENLQDSSRFTQDDSEIPRSGSMTKLVWDSDDTVTSAKDFLQLAPVCPFNNVDTFVSVEVVSPACPYSTLPSNSDRRDVAQQPLAVGSSGKVIHLTETEDQDPTAVQSNQGPRILTSDNNMVPSDDIPPTLDFHSPPIQGPPVLPITTFPTQSLGASDIMSDLLPVTERVDCTPPPSLPDDTPVPAGPIDGWSTGEVLSSVPGKRRRRSTVWERLAKKKAKALLIPGQVVEEAISVISMDNNAEPQRPTTSKQMVKRHTGQQLQALVAEPLIPVLNAGLDNKFLIKAPVLEVDPVVSNFAHSSSRNIHIVQGLLSSTNPVHVDEDKKACIKAAVLEANNMIRDAYHPRSLAIADSDSARFSLSNVDEGAQINTTRFEVSKMVESHSSDRVSIAPTLGPVIPDISNFEPDNSLAHPNDNINAWSKQGPQLSLHAASASSRTPRKIVLGAQRPTIVSKQNDLAAGPQSLKLPIPMGPPIATRSVALVQLPGHSRNDKQSALNSTSSANIAYQSTAIQSPVLQPTCNTQGRRNHETCQFSRPKADTTISTNGTSNARPSTVNRPSRNLSQFNSTLRMSKPRPITRCRHGLSMPGPRSINRASENVCTERDTGSSRWSQTGH